MATTKHAADRLTLSVAGFGVGISLLSLSVSGTTAALSTACGAALALVNLVVLRTIVARVIEGDIHTKLPLVAAIFVKMGVFMALVYALIANHWVEPIPFTFGLSALVVGLIVGSLTLTGNARRAHPHSESR